MRRDLNELYMKAEIIPYKEPRALAGLSSKLPPLFLRDEKTARRLQIDDNRSTILVAADCGPV